VLFDPGRMALPRISALLMLRSTLSTVSAPATNPFRGSITYAFEPNSREKRASMTENLAIFDARHGAGFRANGAGLPEMRERGKLASDPTAI